MSRLRFIEPDEANSPTREIFQKLVLVPNVLCLMANSDSVIESYVDHHTNLANYKLSARYRKMISLAVSQFNDCSYCIALHTATAVDGGLLTMQECVEARRMKSPDAKADAILDFTKKVLEKRGNIDDETLTSIRGQGFGDQEIVEAIAVISFITLANITANIGKPELDFLEPPPLT